MSENVQKYENWRAITESDYVTMFIKTWFAFVATLRELYPKETLEEVIEKDDVYLPNFDDGLNNGDVEITLTDYEVNDTSISIKAIVNLDYWYDAYSQKRMHAKCKATFTKNTDEITNFKMVFEKLADVPKGD